LFPALGVKARCGWLIAGSAAYVEAVAAAEATADLEAASRLAAIAGLIYGLGRLRYGFFVVY